MAAKRRGLGRGLDALLSPNEEASGEVSREGRLKQIPLEQIQPGRYQPRKDIQPEALQDLAASIKSQGVLQPIVVREIASDRFEIIAGERRWRATQLAGLEVIPAIVKEVPDEAMMAMALIENIQRENLNPIEEAMALHRLQNEFSLTQQKVAEAVGKSRAAVTNLLRLMNLEESVKRMLEAGSLEMGHARALLALPKQEQINLAQAVIKNDYSVRQTEAHVRRLQQKKQDSSPSKVDPDISRLEKTLSDTMGAPVSISHGAKGNGRLVIKYSSLDELDGILAHIK